MKSNKYYICLLKKSIIFSRIKTQQKIELLSVLL